MTTTAECREVTREQETRRVCYLEGETHNLDLRNGRELAVYATPYKPDHGDFGFLFGKEDTSCDEAGFLHGPPAFPSHEGHNLDVNERAEH